MRTRHTTSCSDEADLLPAFNSVTSGDLRLAHIEVACDDAIPMVDVDDIPGKKELRDQRHHAPIRGHNRIAFRSAVVDAKVAAGNLAVEDSPSSELACDASRTRPKKGQGEQLRRVLRAVSDLSRQSVFLFDPCFSRRVESTCEFRIDAKPTGAGGAPACLRYGRRLVRILESRVQRIDMLRRMRDHNARDDRIGRVHGNGGQCLPPSVCGRAEVERLARHRSREGHDGIGVPGNAVDRQSNERPDGRLSGFDDETGLRNSRSRGEKRDSARCEQMMSESAATWHRRKLHERQLTPATARSAAGTNQQ